MNITLISTSTIPSQKANSIQVMMACQGLAELGHKLTLLVPGEKISAFDLLRSNYGVHGEPFEIEAIPCRPQLKRLDLALRTVRRAKQKRADLIYTWTIQAAVFASMAGFPVVYEMHDLPGGRFGKRWFDAFVHRKNKKRVAFITKALMERVLQQFPALSPNDCVIAPNGFSAQDYQDLPDVAPAKRAMGFDAGLLASCSGHLYRGRGVELFLDMAEAIPEISFYWFGGDPQEVERRKAEAAARRLENVRFTGFIEKSKLPLAQAASDILLMPYGREIAGSSGGNSAAICSPMKLFEYLAVGRPIISSDLPVFHEVLDESCALFCEPDKLEDWVTALRRLQNDPQAAVRFAAAARRRSAGFSWVERQQKIMNGITEESYAKYKKH